MNEEFKLFSTETDMFEFHAEQDKNSVWENRTIKDLKVTHYSPLEGLLEGKDLSENDSLFLSYKGNPSIPLRDTALKGLFDRAKISGKSLDYLDGDTLTNILNKCLNLYNTEALCLIRDGKITACHSGTEYKILPISKIFEILKNTITSKFEDSSFRVGYTDYSFTSAVWQIVDEKLEGIYESLIGKSDISCFLRLCTSDTGVSAVRISPILKVGMIKVPIGNALVLEHKGEASMDKLKEMLDSIFSLFVNQAEKLEELEKIHIEYPLNCMTRICKSLCLPKKASLEAIKKFEDTYVETKDDITARDIYFGICEILDNVEDFGKTGKKLVDLEETVSRVLHINFANYDLAKNISW